MLKREDLIKNPSLAVEKAVGALCGLAIGDSLGDAARKPENQRDYGITTDFLPGDSWSTDDTEFALLTARILLETGGEFGIRDVERLWRRHVVCEDELRRGGLSEVEACDNLRKGIGPPFSGRYNAYYMSDGAAMRSAPIGILCAGDPDRVAALAQTDACISHYRDGIWGAQAVAVAVSLAMVDMEIPEIVNKVLSYIPEDSWFFAAMERMRGILSRASYDINDAWMPLHYELFSTHRSTVAEAIPEVFGSLLLSHASFKEGLLLAVNFGKDANTIGAIAGAVLGARYGLSQIPSAWVEKTRYPSGTCLSFTKGIDICDYGKRLGEGIK